MREYMSTVSVVIPTYNRGSVIDGAIQSVLNQTHTDFELLVVDDASTDDTEQVLRSQSDPRIQYIWLEENQGANTARNIGVEEASGEFIAFLDSDDIFTPEKLEVCVTELEKQEDSCAGVFHSMQFKHNGEVADIYTVDAGAVTQEDLFGGNPIGGFSDVVFRASIFDKVGSLDEELPAYQDYEFFLRVLENHTMYGIPDVLSTKRDSIPRGDASRISDQLDTKVEAQKLLVKEHPDLISKKVKSEFHYTRGFLHMRRGDAAEAQKAFKTAIRVYPTNPLYYYHYLASIGGVRLFRRAVKVKKKAKLLVAS